MIANAPKIFGVEMARSTRLLYQKWYRENRAEYCAVVGVFHVRILQATDGTWRGMVQCGEQCIRSAIRRTVDDVASALETLIVEWSAGLAKIRGAS